MTSRPSELRGLLAVAALGIVVLAGLPQALADTPPSATEAPDVTHAREAFVEGAALVKRAQWAEALAAFERSSKLLPHAVTTYNIGACERAMGSYTLARGHLAAALAENEAAGGKQLSESLQTDTRALLVEIDHLLASLTVTLTPPNATIAVDGRPLAAGDKGPPPVLLCGVRTPGPGEPAPASVFRLVLNPGAHVLVLSGEGFGEAVVPRTLAPGAQEEVHLALDRLPARLHVDSAPAGAIVTIDDVDVGPTPVDVLRAAGSYRVQVRQHGYVAYDTRVLAHAGEPITLSASLPLEKPSLTQRWWFWTAAGVVVAGGAALTYAVTRPTPQPPPYDSGSANWLAHAQGIRW